MDAFGGWVLYLNESFLGYILCHIFVGILSILLHVDFKCIFILDLLWVMWKWVNSLFQVSLQVVSKLWFYYFNPRLNPWECMRG